MKLFKQNIDNFFKWVKGTELVELTDIDVSEDPVRPELDLEWRLSAEDKKQGSSDETVEYDISPLHENCKEVYQYMLKDGIAPEMARMVLPQSMMTEWYWSGTLYAFARVCNLRCKPDAQVETQMVANEIDKLAEDLFPYSWEALRDG